VSRRRADRRWCESHHEHLRLLQDPRRRGSQCAFGVGRSVSSTSIWCPTGTPVSTSAPGQTVTRGTVPREIGPALDAANNGLSVLRRRRSRVCSTRPRRRSAGSARRCSDWSTAPRRSSATSSQYQRRQRHHQQFGADHRQPGQLGRRDPPLGGEPEQASPHRPPRRTRRCAAG